MSGQALPKGLRKIMNNLSENFQASKNLESEAEIPDTRTYCLSHDDGKPFNGKKYL
jgi:hypothetical protein